MITPVTLFSTEIEGLFNELYIIHKNYATTLKKAVHRMEYLE
jgi:hypothetical protein